MARGLDPERDLREALWEKGAGTADDRIIEPPPVCPRCGTVQTRDAQNRGECDACGV